MKQTTTTSKFSKKTTNMQSSSQYEKVEYEGGDQASARGSMTIQNQTSTTGNMSSLLAKALNSNITSKMG